MALSDNVKYTHVRMGLFPLEFTGVQWVQKGIQLFPVSTLQDLLQSEQLAARGFWDEISIEGKARVKYPGVMARLSEKAISSKIKKSPSAIGEHNEEGYLKELSF